MERSGEPTRLHLEVQLTEPIRGRLYRPPGDGPGDRPFMGWLGLMSAIEAAARTGSPREARQEGDTR